LEEAREDNPVGSWRIMRTSGLASSVEMQHDFDKRTTSVFTAGAAAFGSNFLEARVDPDSG